MRPSRSKRDETEVACKTLGIGKSFTFANFIGEKAYLTFFIGVSFRMSEVGHSFVFAGLLNLNYFSVSSLVIYLCGQISPGCGSFSYW